MYLQHVSKNKEENYLEIYIFQVSCPLSLPLFNSPISIKTPVTLRQVHNLQKLKNISLKAVNFFATKTKVTCLSERVFFHLHIPELPQFSRPCG